MFRAYAEPRRAAMRHAFGLGLRGRLLLLFLGLFAVLFGMLTWLALAERDEDIRVAEERLEQSVKLIATEQRRIIKHADSLLRALPRLPQLRQDHSPQECSRVLSNWQETDASFFNIGLVKTNGDIACMGVPMTSSINLADRTYPDGHSKCPTYGQSNCSTPTTVN